MKKRKPVLTIFQKLYGLLERRQKVIFLIIVLIMILSAGLSQMTPTAIGWLNRCLEGTVRLEKLVFMDFAPAIFNSIAAVITIFCTLPVVLVLPMLLVIPIGTAIVFRQISTQRGIRVELLETKSAMDGTIVELLKF